MTRPLVELVEQFCQYQLKQRGRTEGGVQTARWNLEQILVFVRMRYGKVARLSDLNRTMIQEWMDDMAAKDLSVSSMRTRQSTLSSFCTWLVKREVLTGQSGFWHGSSATSDRTAEAGPDAGLDGCADRGGAKTATAAGYCHFLILRFTGMRRASVATLQSQALGCDCGDCEESV